MRAVYVQGYDEPLRSVKYHLPQGLTNCLTSGAWNEMLARG